jgi:S1-C subfamily serine protease
VTDGAVARVTVHTVHVEMSNMGDLGAQVVPMRGASPAAYSFSEVVPDGAAHAAGLRDGDVLVAVDDHPADGEYASAAGMYVWTRAGGTSLRVRVRRASSEELIDVVVVLRPLGR